MPALTAVVTGGIGSGKSTLVALLARRGARVIHVDAIGRRVLEPDGGAHAEVVEAFGAEVLDDQGRIDRTALAAIVFADRAALQRLNSISHPAINRELEARLGRIDAGTIAVLDMAVFVESDLGQGSAGPLYDVVVTVEAPIDVRIRRLIGRGMDEAGARARIASQAGDEQRRQAADIVIDNSGSPDDLDGAATRLWSDLLDRAGSG